MPTDLPLSVWRSAQQPAGAQRAGRYVELSGTHPARMLPAIAKRAIATYTKPGDLVVDPLCGVGTTLVEAAHLGRDAIGIEYEQHWADLAAGNVAHARSQGATGEGEVICGDGRDVASLVDPAVRGLVALAEAAGFTYLQHVVALHAAIRDDDLAARPSFWQRAQTHKARTRGEPAHLVVHEDRCVFSAGPAQLTPAPQETAHAH